jgi:hypothetical protein
MSAENNFSNFSHMIFFQFVVCRTSFDQYRFDADDCKCNPLEEIGKRTQQASILVNNLSKIADQITSQLVANHKAKNPIII